MVEIKDLTYSYLGSRENIFDGFNLRLEDSKVYGLLGKNGTGKSTLLYLISGLLRHKHGSVVVNGHEISEHDTDTLKDLFIVPEEYDLPNMTLATYIKMNKPFFPKFSEEILENCLRDFDMPLNVNMKNLSMGQKKKVYMSFAIATNTSVLLMDEPTNGLDIPSKSRFRKVIANNMSDERMVVISTHQVHDVETLLDHVMILDRSGLLFNMSTAELCEKYAFEFRQPSEMDGNVIYAEPTLQGNAVIVERKEDYPETSINLELLFNAVNDRKIIV